MIKDTCIVIENPPQDSRLAESQKTSRNVLLPAMSRTLSEPDLANNHHYCAIQVSDSSPTLSSYCHSPDLSPTPTSSCHSSYSSPTPNNCHSSDSNPILTSTYCQASPTPNNNSEDTDTSTYSHLFKGMQHNAKRKISTSAELPLEGDSQKTTIIFVKPAKQMLEDI